MKQYSLMLLVCVTSLASVGVDARCSNLNCFDFVTTEESYSVLILTATLNGGPLPAGSEVAVFDGDVCVGAAEWTGSPLGLPTWADDPQTTDKDGYECGNVMGFQVCYWDSDSQEWRTCGADADLDQGDGLFCTGAMTAVAELTAVCPDSCEAPRFSQTDESYSILFLAIDPPAALEVGDWICVYDDTLCTGCAQWDGNLPFGVPSWKDDDQTPQPDGHTCDNPMSFKMYDCSTSRTLSIKVISYEEGDGTFCKGAITVINRAESADRVSWGLVKSMYR